MGFPSDFLFGTANADHQVEAHDPSREDVWDLWERSQKLTERGRATDFQHRYEEDIAAAAELGCKVFRFSIAWARVEPECGSFDPEMLDHYRKVADCVKGHGMQLMVTLHHFVWPLWLERDHGGMIGKGFPDLFARFADRVAEAFGDRVDWWITFNEPSQLTFGYIKPWWQSRYYMPPGLPRGSEVDAEAEAVGRLIPNLFRAHARARGLIRTRNPEARVGVNPLVTGFPPWLQKLMDWGACHRGLQEALFKFTSKGALVSERGDVDLVIGGISVADETRHEFSDPYLRTGKAVLVRADHAFGSVADLAGKKVGLVAVGNQAEGWRRDLPAGTRRQAFRNYDDARSSLEAGGVDALYGDAFFLMPPELRDQDRFRFLAEHLSDENYVVVAPHGHARLVEMVDRAVADVVPSEHEAGAPEPVQRKATVPCSLHEVFRGEDSLPERLSSGRGVRRVRRRGKIRIGIRTDAPGLSEHCDGDGLEMRLARRIAAEVLGDESKLEIVPLVPGRRLEVLTSKSSWLNWAWRFWGTTCLIANSNWWYLGTSGRLPEELCPAEAVGAQDFVGLDYYWGLPTTGLHRFRLLEDAAHGRFLKAPVWPRGLFHALRRFGRWFPDQDLFIVENGCPPKAGGMSRGGYMDAHLDQVEKALDEGLRIKGYNWWSITSNREWGHPFDPNTDFGLYFVDLDRDPELRRVPTDEVDRFRAWIAKAESATSQEP
ncbi:6-phospho-beta-glucosidase [Haloferula helveola]|uniref:6-phospho-beta-glucosidase n=1 Tax=Haloferula helveola TaxID=490095 RepID=A0ABN6H3R6_9BACT|nr:6-phospho-beta-glucosidase [Haloferula helveola]